MISVEQSYIVEEVATLEIPYNQSQIPLETPYDITPKSTSPYSFISLVIIVLSLFPFDSMKAVSWDYDSAVYINGKKVENESLESKEENVNITRISGVTRSGRFFAPIPLPDNNNEVSDKAKGKHVVSGD